MSENLKRLLTFLVAASMVFSMMPMTALADETTTVTPEESVGPRDPSLSGGTEPSEPETEPSEEPTETTEASDIRSLYVHPVSVVEGTTGFWDTESGNYHYGWYTEAYYEVVMADGARYEGKEGFEHNGVYYTVGSHDKQYETPWLAGNTYEATFVLTNDDTQEMYTQQVAVTITPTPVERIEVKPLSLLQYTHGSPVLGDGFYYRWYNYMEWTVYYKDGNSVTGQGTCVEYNGQDYYFDVADDQNENSWTLGTYQPVVRFMGVSTEANVEITDCFVQDILVSPIEIVPGSNVTIYGDGTGTTYQHYNWWNTEDRQQREVTIVFIDGSSYTTTEGRFYYNGMEYGLYFEDDQGYDNYWTAGNTYTGRIVAAGYTKEVPVTILENPISNIVVRPVRIYEKTSGGAANYYPGGPGSKPVQYYEYHWWNKLVCEIEFKDGSRLNTQGSNFEYQGKWYSILTLNEQSYHAQWVAGNTYNAKVFVMGMTLPVSVTIAESPVRDVVFEPVAIEENTSGYWESTPAGKYYTYNGWTAMLKYTVYFTDGTSCTAQGWGFDYNGEHINITSASSNQNYENPWLAGNTYEGELELLGTIYTVPVSIYRQNNENGFTYLVQNEQAVINSCNLTTETLVIPATLGGYPVVGITSLGEAVNYAKTIEIPDSVTMLSTNAFKPNQWTYNIPLEHLVLGAGITQIELSTLSVARNLQSITVAESNPAYCSVDGVLYTKDVTVMVVYPAGRRDTHVIPDSVTDIDILFENRDLYYSVSFEIGAGVEDYVSENGVIYNKDKTEIVKITSALSGDYVMPDTITSIASGAFENTKITSLTVSKGVKEIAYAAFAGCKALKTVTLPEGIQSIGSYAFADCVSLESVVLPDGCASVDSVAFLNCESLESVTVPSTMQYFGRNAFSGCYRLNAVYAETAERWMRIVFENYAANPVYFANNLYFQNVRVENLEIPSVITVIYNNAFAGIDIYQLTVPEQVFSIGDNAFYESTVQSVSLSEGLYEIGHSAFERADVQVVSLPDTVDFLGESAFYGCTALERVYIGSGLTSISTNAFANTGLQSITIPKQVEFIGGKAFKDSQLRELNLQCERVVISPYAFANCPLGDLEFGDNVTFMDDCAFCGISATQVKLPTSVTRLTYRVFGMCGNLVSVTIPDSVTYIDKMAFEGSYNLSHVLYTGTEDQWYDIWCDSSEVWDAVVHCNATGDEVTTQMTCNKITYTCSICNTTETVRRIKTAHEFKDGVCGICNQVGYWEYETDPLTGKVTIYGYSDKVNDLVIPSTIDGKIVNAIAPRAFAERTDIRTVTMPDSVITVGESAFEGCTNLRSVTLGKNITRIENSTFQNCYWLSSIELPEGVTYIGVNAFSQTSLRTIELHAVEYIDTGAFSDCWDMMELKLPATVQYISYYAFANTSINELVVPASVEEIKSSAFESCYNLDNIYFQGDALWSYDVFGNVYADAYYPADNTTWQDAYYDPAILGRNLSWHAVSPVAITMQPQSALAGENGEVSATVQAQGENLRYQWYYAVPGSAKFTKADQTGQTFTTTLSEENAGIRVYCEVTNLLGQSVCSDTVTLSLERGDMDGNATVDSNDVAELLLHLSMPDRFSVYGFADLDGNGIVNVDDAVALLLSVSLPADFSLN